MPTRTAVTAHWQDADDGGDGSGGSAGTAWVRVAQRSAGGGMGSKRSVRYAHELPAKTM